MSRRTKRRSRKAGLPPGTPIHIGEQKSDRAKITVFVYDAETVIEREVAEADDIAVLRGQRGVTWVNVDALHDTALLEKVGRMFDLHPLIIEDIANTDQRPKLEDYGQHAYVVVKSLSCDAASPDIIAEQLSLVIGPDYVLSFGEREGDPFDPVRERIRHGRGRIRSMGADYLAYRLLDTIVDHYFVVLESLGEQIETLEEQLLENPTRNLTHELYHLKRELLLLRKSVWPLREVVSSLERGETSMVKTETTVYLRDVYDHTIQVIDTVESYRDVLTGMLEVYLSSVSYRTNVVMRVLTVIATIFMPLTFLAGIWGMNFRTMPELEFAWGYPAALLLMFGLSLVMLRYFKKKGWM